MNILPTKTTIAAKYISTFNFSPKIVNKIDKIAFPKNPVINIFKSKFLLNDFAVKCDKKLIYGGVEGFLGQVSVIDKNHACLRCIFPDFDINKTEIPANLMREMRSSVVIAGALLGRFGKCTFTYPGGCGI